jgi:hypothetical protein
MTKLLECQTDLVTRLQSIAEFGEARVNTCTSPDDLALYFKGVTPPVLGVIYEGMRSQGEQSQAPRGLATVAIFGVYLLVSTPGVQNSNTQQAVAINYLDSIRLKVLGARAPAGHPWKFLVESFVDSNKGLAMWVQRWQTSIVHEPIA